VFKTNDGTFIVYVTSDGVMLRFASVDTAGFIIQYGQLSWFDMWTY